MQKKANPAALLPILEFLLLYLGLGLIFEYVLKIPMGFYSIPIVVIFLVALLTTNSTATANLDGMIESMKYATLSALERPTTPTKIPAARKMSSIVTMFLSPMP